MAAVRPWLGAAAAMLVCWVTPVRAVAQNRLLREGIAAYDDLEYEEAIRRLSAALLVPGSTPDRTAAVYLFRGLSYLLLDRPEPATGAFRNLLALRPDVHFDETTAPRIVAFFEDVRRRWEQDGRPGVVALARPAPRPVRI